MPVQSKIANDPVKQGLRAEYHIGVDTSFKKIVVGTQQLIFVWLKLQALEFFIKAWSQN
jgi:hypothetical protein